VTVSTWIEWSITALFSRATIKLVGEVENWQQVSSVVVQLYAGVGCATGVILWCLAPLLATLFNDPALVFYLRLLAWGLPFFSIAQAHRNILIGVGGFTQRALASACRWTARLVLIILLVELGWSVTGAILGGLGALAVELTVLRWHVRPALFTRASSALPRLRRSVAPLFLSALSLRIARGDLFALKILGGTTAQVGIYGAAQNLAFLPELLVVALAPLLLSTLSRVLYDRQVPLAQEISQNALRAVMGLLPIASMMAGAAPALVQVIFGSSFLSAAPLFVILTFGALAAVMISVATTILTAAGKLGWTFALTGPLAPLALIGYVWAVPQFGTLGVACVATFVTTVGALATVGAVYRLWRILPPSGTVWRSVVISCGAYALASSWVGPDVMLFWKLPLLGFTIVLVFVILGELTFREMTLVRSLIGWPTSPVQSQREV
jgi:O-antigen/teichoic acid export membrane protein